MMDYIAIQYFLIGAAAVIVILLCWPTMLARILRWAIQSEKKMIAEERKMQQKRDEKIRAILQDVKL